MADSIRGDGLFRAHDSLSALVNDPEQLARARQRFDDFPPSYRSQSSGHSTLLESPTPPSEIRRQRSHSEQIFQLESEYHQSHPESQFRAEMSAERCRIREQAQKGIYCVPIEVDVGLAAFNTVKKRWVQQGIWNEKWTLRGGVPGSLNKWKHEEPLEQESEWEADSDAERSSFLAHLRETRKPKSRRLKSDEERQRIAERRTIREREREASRPFYRFVEQVSREREWLQKVSRFEETHVADLPNINTMAYTVVKNAWIQMGLWYHKWGVLPGMSWKHEQPLEQFLRDEMGDEMGDDMGDEHADDAADHTAHEASPVRNIFIAPRQLSGIREPNPLDDLQQRPSAEDFPDALDNEGTPTWHSRGLLPADSMPRRDVVRASSQDGPADMSSVEQPSRDANRAWSTSNSRRGRGDGRATPPQRLTRGASFRRPPAPLAPTRNSTGLGQIRPSKVSKAQRTNQASSRRRGQSRRSEQPFEVQESHTAPDIPENPLEGAPMPLRRSRRLEEARHSRGISPLAGSLNGPVRSRSGRTGAANPRSRNGARPRGVEKRRAARR